MTSPKKFWNSQDLMDLLRRRQETFRRTANSQQDQKSQDENLYSEMNEDVDEEEVKVSSQYSMSSAIAH